MKRIRESCVVGKIPHCLSVAIAFALVSAVGCGGGGSTEGTQAKTTAKLSGTVMSKGKPVENALINFENPAVGAWGTKLEAGGKYSLDIAPGEFKVSIVPSFEAQVDMSMSSDGQIPEAPKRDDVPEKFRVAGTSELSVSVKDGEENTFDVDLK
ncbi:hypothetical protein OAF98_05050 [Planctomicrobium sp.]|nr:hypothetical protein [Planctomicrobium sp.]MDA7527970.1 hypothetical protein [bacterium]MDB4731982.1 hypothetical protein [bacterium]MDB4743834.1 hypothetical protein [Planctomicrobium sp.]